MSIVIANEDDLVAVRELFRAYEAFLNVDLCFQGFENELANLPGQYAAPDGLLLLAKREGVPVGCGAMRRWGPCGAMRRWGPKQLSTCEMKRLYVMPESQGLGLGKAMAFSLVQCSRELGYRTMLLDTLARLDKAIELYESMGFQRIAPYYNNPLKGVVYMKLNLD